MPSPHHGQLTDRGDFRRAFVCGASLRNFFRNFRTTASSGRRWVLALAVCAGTAAAAVAADAPETDESFVRRLGAKAFEKMEAQADHRWSRSSDLVFYRADETEVHLSWRIYRLKGSYFLENGNGGKIELPKPIARQVLLAFEQILTRNVTVQRHPRIRPDATNWDNIVFLRSVEGPGIAGLIQSGCSGPIGDFLARTYNELVSELENLSSTDAESLNAALTRLDFESGRFLGRLGVSVR